MQDSTWTLQSNEVKKEVSKIIPKVEKLVIDQLESEVLVRSSKEANTSHAVRHFKRQLYKDLVEAYEADKILLDTYGDTIVHNLKDLEMVQMMIKNPPLEQTGGPREVGQEGNPLLPVLQVKRHQVAERTPVQDLRTHKKLLAICSSREVYAI
ncbi:hypothetical protein Tco_0557271 [Tanacetum coccineum]